MPLGHRAESRRHRLSLEERFRAHPGHPLIPAFHRSDPLRLPVVVSVKEHCYASRRYQLAVPGSDDGGVS